MFQFTKLMFDGRSISTDIGVEGNPLLFIHRRISKPDKPPGPWRPFRRPGDRVGGVVGRAVLILEHRSARPHIPRLSETDLVETPRL
jgi:hypothetical protein